MNFASIRVRLLGMTGLLSLAFIAYLLVQVGSNYRAIEESSRVTAVSEVAVATSDFAHELQKERGMSAGFLSSRGKKFATEIVGQRKLTDARREALQAARQAHAAQLPEQFARRLDEAADFAARIGERRNGVSDLTLPPADSFDFYTRLIDLNFAGVASVAPTLANADIARRLVAYHGFILSKEYAGRERALLNGTFASDAAIPDAVLFRLSSVLANQATHLETFRAMADEESIQALDALLASDVAKSAANMRKIALESAKVGSYGVVPADWFSTITNKIDAMKQIEDGMAEKTIAAASQVQSDARNSMVWALVVTFVVMMISILYTRMLMRVLRDIHAISLTAQRLAEGDLTQTVAMTRKDEVGDLQDAMARTMARLTEIIGNVLTSADQLTSAASQVSSTAQSLSQSSTEQAASVEETSASIEQMSSSISHNTENAKVTDGMAAKAATEAIEGGDAVARTVQDMKSIATKISIIDDIAYQTNLLALNAAIEAARAGEHGRGFAVVASEVRKLAERSQTAAQEIGDLASSSVEQAERAGKLLGVMVPTIRKTSDLVQEIASASAEQSAGVAQINAAMCQLNQTTQQNAASSEELAATSETMSTQAEQLQQVMAFFKLEHREARPTHPGVHERSAKVRAEGTSAPAMAFVVTEAELPARDEAAS